MGFEHTVTQASRPAFRTRVMTCAAWCALCLFASPLDASTLFDPALRFRTLRTEHFIIYFHGPESAGATRLATVAEETWRSLQRSLAVTPPPLTHVVLADQSERANGWASPLPYNTIVITAAWPPAWEFIGHTDDWLRLVFIHEFTHIVHLDRSRGWSRLVRRIFGRTPLAFPNLFLPGWQVEGLATYEESVVSGGGRLHAGNFLAIEREAARARRMEPLDRVNGGLIDWPGGLAPYSSGLGFHAYLADREGVEKIAALADGTAGRLPYTASRVFSRIYGRSLGTLWDEYERSLTAAIPIAADDRATRLTRQGFVVLGPRFAPAACETCLPEILYSVQTPHGFPSLNAVGEDGSGSRQLASRYLGATSGVSGNLVVFDQQEFRRNIGLYSDLFLLDRRTARVTRLTSEARLLDPDLSPDGQTIVCVRNAGGRRDLVLVRLHADAPEITTFVSEPDTQFETPRWSPDGRSIAVARRRRSRESEIVIVDAATGRMRTVASGSSARIVTPAWRPDGLAIVAAAAFGGEAFNLYEFMLDGTGARRQLTRTTGGATWPDVSPDGRTIVFVGYSPAGFDLFTIPYASPAQAGPASGFETSAGAPAPGPGPPAPTGELAAGASYRPWPTLKPTSWTPIVDNTNRQLRLGVATGGRDVLGYHAYAASATWLAQAPDEATAPSRTAPDISLVYSYDRWQPTLFGTFSTATSFFAGPPTESGAPGNITLRERELQVGVQLPVLRARSTHRTLASIVRSVDRYSFPDTVQSVSRTAVRAGWATTTARTYGYSISPENGFSLGATGEWTRKAFGSSADATTFTADARAYLRGLRPHHVVALRAAGGSSTGDALMRRTFLLGGSSPEPDVLEFDNEALSLLRGFPADTFAGTHAAIVNADYRFPIARPQRGRGTWPLFLRTIHGAVFIDAGHVWTGGFRMDDTKRSFGGELSLDVVAGYYLPLTATLGVAAGHDGASRVPASRTVYLRLGRAF